MDTTPNSAIELDEPQRTAPAPPATEPPLTEPKGCLYALSQPPLMLFLAVIALLLAITGAHDLIFL
ncbi:hypothetical protein [Streptomyces axinellae]|uniref:Uncharacterized protein n=1 Tax=Streptomyces axinellae TaxID=552788 RepID=A0ABN3PM32_9ACTN